MTRVVALTVGEETDAREGRHFRKASAARLAEIAQLSRRDVQRIEAGTANPRLAEYVQGASPLA